MKKALVILLALVALYAIAIFVSCVVGSMPPVPLTEYRMSSIERRIREYARIHHRPPHELSDDLPGAEGGFYLFHGPFDDGWGRDIVYTVKQDGMVSLSSFGKDGKPGGTGLDEDIVVEFEITCEGDSSGKK